MVRTSHEPDSGYFSERAPADFEAEFARLRSENARLETELEDARQRLAAAYEEIGVLLLPPFSIFWV